MALAEREREHAFLDHLYLTSTQGRCQAVLVGGVVGSGKTELLHIFSERAMENGAIVLTALGSSAERSVPFGLLGQLFNTAQSSAVLEETVTGLLKLVPARSGVAEAASSVRMEAGMMDALCREIARLAKMRPIVIAIDDVQYADVPSLECLLYLMRRLRSASLMLVFSEPGHAQHYNPFFRTELLRYRLIRLSLLSQAGVQTVLDEHLGEGRARELADEWHAVSGGNPLLVRALLDDYLTATGAPPDSSTGLVVRDSFGQAVLACLYRGGAEMVAVARALAMLGDPIELGLLGRLLEMAPESVEKVIEELTATGLLVGKAFRHRQAQAAILADLPEAERRQLHLRAARLLYEAGAPVDDVACHLLSADNATDSWAQSILLKAAKQVLREDGHEQAAAFLKLALQACDDDGERAVITAMLAATEWRINPAMAIPHLTPLTDALRDGRLPDQDARGLLHAMLWDGRFDEALMILEMLDSRSDASDVGIRAELRVLSSRLRTHYPGLAARMSLGEVDFGTNFLSSRQRAADLLYDVLTGGGDGKLVGMAERILGGAYLDDEMIETIECTLLALVYSDRSDKAAQWCDQLLEEADSRRVPSWQAILSALRAEMAFRQGDLSEAERYGQAALTHIPFRGWGVTVGGPAAVVVLAQTAMGNCEAAAEILSRPVPDALFETRYGLQYLYARGQHSLATNRLDSALADFLTCGHLMSRWNIDLPALVPWRSAAAMAFVRLGDIDQARRLSKEQLTRPGSSRPRSKGISLRALAKASELPQRPGLLREAVEDLRRSGDQFELARALAELGLAHQALGEPTRSRTIVDQALQLAGKCEAAPLCRGLLRRRAGTVVETPSASAAGYGKLIGALSEAERRVAALASLGHSNREIADRLFITVSTVEQHLTRVYRKLGVRRRTDLPVLGFQMTMAGSA